MLLRLTDINNKTQNLLGGFCRNINFSLGENQILQKKFYFVYFSNFLLFNIISYFYN